jgi:hypothetical protein
MEVERARLILHPIFTQGVVDHIIIAYLIHKCEYCFQQLDEKTLSCLKEAKITIDVCEECLQQKDDLEDPAGERKGSDLERFCYAKYSFDCIQCGERVRCWNENKGNGKCSECSVDDMYHGLRRMYFVMPAIGFGLFAGGKATLTGLLMVVETVSQFSKGTPAKDIWKQVRQMAQEGAREAATHATYGLGATITGLVGEEIYYQATKRRKKEEKLEREEE